MAAGIKNTVPEHPASHAVLKFAIAAVLNVSFIISLTLGISVFTGQTSKAVLILISFALLRQVSGGVHLKSGTKCVLFTVTLFTLLSYADLPGIYIQSMNLISLSLVLWLAPIGIDRQTRIPKRYWPLLKVIAAALILSNFLIGSSVIAASFLAQSVSLLIARKGVNSA
ncbi:accessory gene regulator B family protein [Paenibacillus sp. PK3_47]|uniref:accessory gene regulator B family protein n=1 Tax=Paenibacillus sp. PK3_47 TaxID=2072642 RepID=UPI00201D711D|nr:accessory gene regulator B family protein [Paenibacillus sp. PK3_47]